MATVAITQDDDITRAITQGLQYFDIEELVRGKVVAVKPNDTWASAKDRTAVTQPDSLQAVLRYIKEFWPGQLIVTGGAGAGETDQIFEVAGLMDVVRQERAPFSSTTIRPHSKRCASNMVRRRTWKGRSSR